jgi:hypothetical protein
MLEGATLTWAFLAFALLHGAEARRRPSFLSRLPGGSLRVAAVAALALSISTWTRVEGMAAAILVVLAALSLAATLFVLMAPLLPRVTWVLALASGPIAVALSLMGGHRG